MYVFDNLEHSEIAEELGISVGTSKSNLAKARRNLKRLLEDIQKNRADETEGLGEMSKTE
jgi:RNA polymerase sigma-70 factor (ECF subfamily)